MIRDLLVFHARSYERKKYAAIRLLRFFPGRLETTGYPLNPVVSHGSTADDKPGHLFFEPH
jgi:hypothetical protein